MWASVQDFTAKVGEASSVSEINRCFGDLVGAWGFETWVAIQVSSRQTDLRAPLARSFGSPPVIWLDRYREAGHVHRDAGIRRIMSSLEPFWWSDLRDERLEKNERLVLDEAAEHGIRQGLVVPVRLPDGSIWSCALASSEREADPDVRLGAHVAANFFVGRGVMLQQHETRRIDLAYRLTRRQREVVRWIARGLTVDEIGEALGTSAATVANQIADAKRRLGARTQASLVTEALLHGEIHLHDVR